MWRAFVVLLGLGSMACAGTKTWDGKYDTSQIEVTVAYFVPADRQPLEDWRERVDYYCRRIELFHQREFGDQSRLRTVVVPEPFISRLDTPALREGDADQIFFRTLGELDERLSFARERTEAYPILLALSDLNWRPLDDFYRAKPVDGGWEFEGNYNQGQHFPGAAAGGARAAYLGDRGVGWGLVSADGWRVPYRGSDCVIYHEGCGHTVGLPHPEPGNGSVMSLGQYQGWLSESWLDKEQKLHLAWNAEEPAETLQMQLFSEFTALPSPLVPRPGEQVELKLQWPQRDDLTVESIRLRYQTQLHSPWVDVAQSPGEQPPQSVSLGTFDRATPVSYRIDVCLKSGETVELWGYLQVRREPEQPLFPRSPVLD